MAKLYSEQRAIRVKRIVDRKRTYVLYCYTLYTCLIIYLVLSEFMIDALHFHSSRLQPEKYRRLLGSAGSRTRRNFNINSSLGTIDRDPSPQVQSPDSDDGDSSETGGAGEGGSGEEEEEVVEVVERRVGSDEGATSTLRNRKRRRGAEGGGRDVGKFHLIVTYDNRSS